ncbi:MAG: hypothetical protein JWO89_1744 [Verrucomicrobiaceae bacterium]|nr:hypothetical protein [Verrucomicrobiaceae bacterium]
MNHYPEDVPTQASQIAIEHVRRYQPCHIAEIGINKGATSLEFAALLGQRPNTSLHLFDFADKVADVTGRVKETGYQTVHGYPVSSTLHDSYNWNLMRVLQAGKWQFDYVFIDGAHTWNIDALAFLLVDRLLTVGGLVELDDYVWSIRHSPTMNPDLFPMSRELYTEEQINERQVALVIDLLVKPDRRYEELMPNRLYRKVAA